MTGLAKTLGRTAASMTAVTTILSRKLALAAGLVCVATPVLSSCGFDYATDRPNVIANGGFAQSGTGMRVLATRIVADTSNQGVFIATLALNPTANPAVAYRTAPKLTGLAARTDSPYTLTAAKFAPITVTSTGAVNMAEAGVGGIPVTGDFKAGSMVPVTLTFSDGEEISVQTPVVTQCHEFESVAPQASGKPSASTDATAEEPSAEPTAPYDCSFPSLPATTDGE
jgi:hypothetical protein